MNPISLHPSSIVRLLIFVCWGCFVILLLKRDVFITTLDNRESQTIKLSASTEYQAIYFRNNKIGYVISVFAADSDNEWRLEQKARMNLNVSQSTQTIDLHLNATLLSGNKLKKFNFSFQSPFYQMTASGSVSGNSVSYVLNTGTNTIQDTRIFETPPLLSTSRRAYLLEANLKTGEKRKIPWFDPFSLNGKESILEYRGKESILINARVEKLHRFTETFSGTRVNFWLNDAGTVVKEESPAGFVFQKEPKFKALSLSENSDDLLAAVAIKTKGEVKNTAGKTMKFRLALPDSTRFDLDGDRQQMQNDILTVRLEEIPEDTSGINCDQIGASLLPSAYIQSGHQSIKDLSNKITFGLGEPVQQVKQLGLWVYENLDKRPVLGLPDALTTLEKKQGDCNEHAALFAALARSVSIPTRVVAGVTYHKNAFYYHAWNEVCLGNNWISIDTTTNQFPADLTHLRFVKGEMREQVRISALLGNLTIEQIQ